MESAFDVLRGGFVGGRVAVDWIEKGSGVQISKLARERCDGRTPHGRPILKFEHPIPEPHGSVSPRNPQTKVRRTPTMPRSHRLRMDGEDAAIREIQLYSRHPVMSVVRSQGETLVTFDYAGQIGSLSDEQRLHFYEVLAHQLTIAARGVWSDNHFTDSEKVAQLEAINEILHRVTARVFNLRLRTDNWTETHMSSCIQGWVSQAPAIGPYVGSAIKDGYLVVTSIRGEPA
jgi:hypothetical protein